MSSDSPIQGLRFYLSGFVSLVSAILKFTAMVQRSWWRVLLPLWVMLDHTASYLLVGLLCLFAVRYGEDEEEQELAKVPERPHFLPARIAGVWISADNLLRWLERGGKSYWFWLGSGKMAIAVLFGLLPPLRNFCIGLRQ